MQFTEKEMLEFVSGLGYKSFRQSFRTYRCLPAPFGVHDFTVELEMFYKDKKPYLGYSGLSESELFRATYPLTLKSVFEKEMKDQLLKK